ncbi:MAG: hypothetical protein ACRDBO_04750 [Lachnospiraceae bacterium]
MDWKTKVTNSMRSAASDKESLNRQVVKWNKSFKEVEKILNRSKGEKKEEE